jgi:Flp pilus assembly protein TadG
MNVKHRRKQKGQIFAPLGAIIGALIIGTLGIFAFEMGRVVIARDQLRAATDAAALAGATTLASSDLTSPLDAHNKAMEAADEIFRENLVMGSSLSNARQGSNTPAAGETTLTYTWLDPNNNNQPVSASSANGRVLEVKATYGYQPMFLKIILGSATVSVPISALSQGGVPVLDVVICSDLSGSIDDSTKVTFVKRVWDATEGKIKYEIAQSARGPAEGELYEILDSDPLGTAVNAFYPQRLSRASDSDNQYPLTFSPDLRGGPNDHPGNYPPGTASTGDAATFTDLVVNLDGQTTFAGLTTDDGYAFPNIGAVVEAARGNLENEAIFESSGAKTALDGLVTPKSGYKTKYEALVKPLLQPIYSAQDAIGNFCDVMNKNTVAHFSLVGFGAGIGSSADSTVEEEAVSANYPSGGTVDCPLPLISLDPAASTSNSDPVKEKTDLTVAFGSTYISSALDQAITELKERGRKSAKKAIVLFTDGQPTGPGSPDEGSTLARDAARRANEEGIPIFTIGLSQNPEVKSGQEAILTDAAGSDGIAALSGNGAKFFQVTDEADLRRAFEEVARHLTQLVK